RSSWSYPFLDEVELREQLHLVGEGGLAGRKLRVPAHPEVRAVDRRRQLHAVSLVPVRIRQGRGDRAADDGGPRRALDRQLATSRDALPVDVELDRPEPQLGISLRIEE